MTNKLKFYHYWDVKSIISSILTVALFVTFLELIVLYPRIVQFIKNRGHDQVTSGQLISVTPQQHISHSRIGSKLSTGHFLVSFSYEVEGERFIGKELILSAGTVKYQLSKILNSEKKKVKIRYNQEYPARSIILLE